MEKRTDVLWPDVDKYVFYHYLDKYIYAAFVALLVYLIVRSAIKMIKQK